MLDEILRDTGTGHRVIATVFVECLSMYRAEGPESLKPVGETEFVNGIAAQSASGQYGPLWFRLRNMKLKHWLVFVLVAVALEVATLFVLRYL
jgi:hypothetical protein